MDNERLHISLQQCQDRLKTWLIDGRIPRKKAREVSRSYAQKQAQNYHPQRIYYKRVAVSNASLLAFRR